MEIRTSQGLVFPFVPDRGRIFILRAPSEQPLHTQCDGNAYGKSNCALEGVLDDDHGGLPVRTQKGIQCDRELPSCQQPRKTQVVLMGTLLNSLKKNRISP